MTNTGLTGIAAERVCELDWSDNDKDAVKTIDDLRKALRA